MILDDCNFHESVHLDNFDLDRTLSLVSAILKKYALFLQECVCYFMLHFAKIL